MSRAPSKLKGSAIPAELELVRRELELNRFDLPTGLAVSGRDLLREIAYVLRPRAHERRIAPYGIVIASGTFEQGQKVSSAPPLDASFIRLAADGRRTFLLYHAGGGPELWRVAGPCDTELDLLNLADETQGLALKRIESGLVSVAHGGRVYTVRGREWLVRRPIAEMWDAIAQVAPGRVGLARPLLELCCYVMSPKNLGTTIVWYLTEPTLDEATTWTDKPDVRPLSLSIDESADYAEIAHLARHHDGAFLVAPDGVIRSLAGQLTYTHPTATLLSSYRGTRHTSAKYYSYEHPAAMVFVTSEDGGVSVFSDGAKLADSPVLPAGPPWLGLFKGVPADALWPMAALHDQEPDEAKPILSEFSQTTCDQCGKTLAIQILTMAGTIHENTVSCPICDKSGVYTATCLGLKATPLKNI